MPAAAATQVENPAASPCPEPAGTSDSSPQESASHGRDDRVVLTPPPFPDGEYLYLDAASREPFVGILRVSENGAETVWQATRRASAQAATESLFAMLADIGAGGAALARFAGFIFAEGPGSILGIRIAAAALRTWRTFPELAAKPIFAINSLELAAALLLRAKCAATAKVGQPFLSVPSATEGQAGMPVLPSAVAIPASSARNTGEPPVPLSAAAALPCPSPPALTFTVLADSRQGFWNTLVVRDGRADDAFRELPADALATLPAPRYRIVQRAASAPPPAATFPFPENALELDPAALATPGLARRTDAPDAINLPATFAKWTPPQPPPANPFTAPPPRV